MTDSAKLFNGILADHASAQAAVAPKAMTYRDWEISFDMPPIPFRNFDWCATHKDFDGAPDANDGRQVHAATYEELLVEIDCWIDENSEEQGSASR